MIRIAGCADCGQHFASVFCEPIKWTGGDDSMDSFLLLPFIEETEALIAAGASGIEGSLRHLRGVRRQLVRFIPRPANHPGAGFVTPPTPRLKKL
jgi:hypothetical protein